MIPWLLIDKTTLPDGEELSLHQRGDEFVIRVNRHELMNSRFHGSEEIMATLACEHIAMRPQPRVLIGGLGMGFTLAACLKALPRSAHVVVAELMAEVVAWNRGPMARLSGNACDDSRVTLYVGDVANPIKQANSVDANRKFDAILLDIDNGPEGLTQQTNDWIYSVPGLQAARSALTTDGVLAIWSVSEDAAFHRRLKKCGFDVTLHPVRAHGSRGRRHFIWLAQMK